MFDSFAQKCLLNIKKKEDQAEAIIWYHYRQTGERDIDIKLINDYFERAFLPKLNITRAKKNFAKSKNICQGKKAGLYKLTLAAIKALDNSYGSFFKVEFDILDEASIFETPLLGESDIQQAQEMAKIYLIIHCYENSARKLIETVLSKKLGLDWWNIVANREQKKKVDDRKKTEQKNMWLTPRGENPLYYIDWKDLLSIIRKYEDSFLPLIKDIKFIELRFEELERVRNITAHNGFLPNDEDFQRVLLSFRDWCRQLKTIL